MIKAMVTAAIVMTATTASAQRLKAPEASPEATVEQTIGLTSAKVVYHRPAIANRQVWGNLVPYGAVWRAGANENTTVTFSTDVKIEGKGLKAGTYGLHMIPTQKDWTVIFSNMSVAWGSFTYDQKEDALRVTVKPRAVQVPVERLAFRFDDPTDTKTSLVLAWEKVEVPVSIEADTPKIVMASMKGELRGTGGFTWEAWNEAAAYYAAHGGAMDEAMKMVDRSITMHPAFANMNTRARILDKQGKTAEAKELRTKGLALATEPELNQYGYQLMADKKQDEAIALFKTIVEKFPQSWNAHDSLAEALAGKGDKAGAVDEYTKALALVKDAPNKKRIETTIANLKK